MAKQKKNRTPPKLPFQVTKVFWMIVKIWDLFDILVLQGGTSSGKTYATLQWLILKGAEKKRKITIVAESVEALTSGAQEEFLNILSRSAEVDSWFTNKLDGARKYTMFNGTKIEFKSFDKVGKAKAAGKRDILYANEVDGLDYDVFYELYDRTTEKTIIDYNPTAKFWVHTRLLGQVGVKRIISNFTHNRFCAKSVIKKLLGYRLTNPFRWKVYGLGKTGQVEGVIFPNVKFISKDEWPNELDMRRFGYGSDYGFSNDPFTLVRAGFYQGKIYAQGLIYEPGLRLSEIVEKIEENNVDQDDIIAFDDSQAKEQAMLLEEDYGYNVKSARRTGGSIKSGIGLLQDYEICILDDIDGNWNTEQENYRWKKVRGEWTDTPIDKFNHYWDALRYWILEMMSEVEEDDYNDENYVV